MKEGVNKVGFLVVLVLSILISGCARVSLREAQNYATKSKYFFRKAVKTYESALRKKEDENLRYQLGLLYYGHRDYPKAIEQLSFVSTPSSQRLVAFCFYQLGDYTSALKIFRQLGEFFDEEYLYYYALTLERQNLYEQSLRLYRQIKGEEFAPLAKERILKIDALREIEELDIETLELIRSSPTLEDYPQAGAAILLCDEKVEVSCDKIATFYIHILVKILNERGKKDFAEVEIGYDSTYEKVELQYARTIRPDGMVVPVGSRHIRDVSKYLNFPLYSNARALIISMPEVSIGSFIEYKAKITRSRLINEKDIVLSYRLQETEPIVKQRFSLSLPKEQHLNIKFLNEEYNISGYSLNPKVREKDDNLIYYWEFQDVAQIYPEPSMPPYAQINPVILLSTFKSWDEIYKWWWDKAKDKLIPNQDIKEKVAELIEGVSSLEDKARAIYNYVAQEIRYVAVEYGEAGYEPHSADLTFKNKYGDCKDQSILLISMLKEAGVEAYPVLIGTKEQFNLEEDFPTLTFNHCIAATKLEKELIFLDPTGETVSFGDLPISDQDRKVLVFLSGGAKIVTTPQYSWSHNRVIYRMRLKINEDESIEGEREVKTFGYYDQAQRYWLRHTQPILIEESLKQKLQDIAPGGRLLDYEIDDLQGLDKPICLRFNFQAPQYLALAGSARVVPRLSGGLDTSLVTKTERAYPIDLELLEQLDYYFEIELPQALSVKYLPKDIEYQTPWFYFLNKYQIQEKKIIFKQTVFFKKTMIPEDEYREFKKLAEEVSQKVRQNIILEKSLNKPYAK